MGRYRKILVAVDGSEAGRNAFRQACRIGRQDKSWITVITTVPIFSDQFDVLSIREKVSATLEADGEKILSDIRKIAEEEDVFIRTLLEEGTPFDTIVDTADEGNFDLIVMGRRGRQRVEKALVGSVTARVIGNSQRSSAGIRSLLRPMDRSSAGRPRRRPWTSQKPITARSRRCRWSMLPRNFRQRPRRRSIR